MCMLQVSNAFVKVHPRKHYVLFFNERGVQLHVHHLDIALNNDVGGINFCGKSGRG